MATKRLRDALADAWTSPTEDLVRMCEEFVELGPVTEDEFAVLRESFARMRKGDAEMTKLKSAVAWATDSIHERLPKMREELADRIHPDLPRQRSLLKGWDCVVARAETPDEVFRCARLAGVDPVRLLEDFRDGTRDVLVAHAGDNRRADSAWQRFFDPNLVAGTRIVDADETAVHGFAPSAEPGLRSALAALDYPPLEVVSRRVAP
jgi:hypothetical protein